MSINASTGEVIILINDIIVKPVSIKNYGQCTGMMVETKNNIVVIGIGSAVLSDSAAPELVIQKVEQNIPEKSNISFKHLPAGGMDLLYDLEGFNRALIVDCRKKQQGNPGEITVKKIDSTDTAFENQSELTGAHGKSISEILQFGSICGCKLPHDIVLIEICGAEVHTLGDKLSPEVEKGWPGAVKMVEQQITEWNI